MTGGRGANEGRATDGWPQRVLDVLPPVVVADRAGHIVYTNSALHALLGWARGELLGRPLQVIIPPRLRSAHSAAFSRYARTGSGALFGHPLRVPALHRDGSECMIDLVLAEVSGGTEVAAILLGVTERRQLDRHSEMLGRLLAALSEASTVEDATPAILEALAGGMGWEVGSLWVTAVDELVCAGYWHDPEAPAVTFEQATRTRRLRRGEGLPGRVWESGESVWLTNVEADGNLPRAPAAVRDGLRSAFAFPVLARRRFVGVIELFTRAPRRPDEQLLSMLTPLGEELGAFMERLAAEEERSRLLEREREARAQLERANAELSYRAALLRAQNEAGIDGLLVVSPTGEILSRNARFAEIWGFPEDAMREASDEIALSMALGQVADPDAFLQRVRELYAQPRPGRDEVHLRDGRVLDRYGTPLLGEDDTYYGFAWYFRDVTQQKRAEEALAESGERFAAVARTLQQSLLPPTLPDVPGIQVAARYHPAGEGLEVGGDFYDVFRSGRARWGIVMGDVCGKGASAAKLTALARYTIRAAAMQTRAPARVLMMLNEALLRDTGAETERFVSVVHAGLQRSAGRVELSVASAGHPPPLRVRPDGSIDPLGSSGLLAGLFRELDAPEATVELAPGDLVVFYTDGVTEARDARGAELGEESLFEVLSGCAGLDAAAAVARIEQAALEWQAGEARDDIALLAVRVLSSGRRRRRRRGARS